MEAHRQDRETIGRWREFTVTTNSLGFRGPEPENPKRRPRVLALGESVSMGWGVRETENWTAQVAIDLDVEVLNVGIPNVEPRTLADWCVAEGRHLDPDVLVWTRRIGGEEPTPEAYISHLSRCAVTLQVPVLVVFPPLSRFDRLGRFNDRDDRTALQAQMPWPLLDLTPAFEAAQSGGAGLGPKLELLDGDLEVARRAHDGIDRFPYGPDFDANPALREPLFFDIGHPDVEGYRVYAEAVSAALQPLLP